MKLICKNCGYIRDKWNDFEDYICVICQGMMNEDKKEFFDSFHKKDIENETIGIDEVIRIHIIDSFKRDIKKSGKAKIWNIIERLSNAKTRASYRRFYFLALEEMKKEV